MTIIEFPRPDRDNDESDDAPEPRSGGHLLLGVHAVVALALVACLAFLPRLQGTVIHAEPSSRLEGLEKIDVQRAADGIASQVRLRERGLSRALLKGDEENLARLLGLQAEAAQLELGDLRFAPGARKGYVQVIEATIEVRGGYYDLPIFVDGLFRQTRVVEVSRVSVEALSPMSARVLGQIEARFYRPVHIPSTLLNTTLDNLEMSVGRRGFAATALMGAARLRAIEAFEREIPDLDAASARNRQIVLRMLPSLVRQLPSSPMGWVAAEISGTSIRTLTEPDLK